MIDQESLRKAWVEFMEESIEQSVEYKEKIELLLGQFDDDNQQQPKPKKDHYEYHCDCVTIHGEIGHHPPYSMLPTMRDGRGMCVYCGHTPLLTKVVFNE